MENVIDWEQKAVSALDAIAEKLGTGVEHFWPMFIKEQVISGFISIAIPITIFSSLVCAVYVYHRITKDKWKISEEEGS